MLNELAAGVQVYLVTGYTDLRRGIDGLAEVVHGKLSLDPYSQALFLFCGRKRDRIKGLLWEGDGFLLLYKCDAAVPSGEGLCSQRCEYFQNDHGEPDHHGGTALGKAGMGSDAQGTGDVQCNSCR